MSDLGKQLDIFSTTLEKFKGQKFMLVSLSIRGDNEIDKVKEWLENDK